MNAKTAWEEYCKEQLARITPILNASGFTLDDVQPHISGERFLMQAVTTTSGKKLILLGKDKHQQKVVIKATNDVGGIRELQHEQKCREVLEKIDFAGEVFHTPEVFANIAQDGYVITVQRYIDQQSSFLERPLEEQFQFALRAFKGQESAHATTFNHRKHIRSVYGIRDAKTYLQTFSTFVERIKNAMQGNSELSSLLTEAYDLLRQNEKAIEQYCSFLTHTDFVPHNIRIQGDTIYLLDHSSLTFGNKYEGWARFINFMTLYNPPLQKALETYVHENRTKEESVSLRMMRIYRLGEIIWYYVQTLPQSSDDLLYLNRARVYFWKDVLSNVVKGQELPDEIRIAYITARDQFRSEDEKKRQYKLH